MKLAVLVLRVASLASIWLTAEGASDSNRGAVLEQYYPLAHLAEADLTAEKHSIVKRSADPLLSLFKKRPRNYYITTHCPPPVYVQQPAPINHYHHQNSGYGHQSGYGGGQHG